MSVLQEAGNKEYSCFDFPAHSLFTFDVFWGSLGTSIFGNSISAANNTRSRVLSRPSFCFLWLWSSVNFFIVSFAMFCQYYCLHMQISSLLILVVKCFYMNVCVIFIYIIHKNTFVTNVLDIKSKVLFMILKKEKCKRDM